MAIENKIQRSITSRIQSTIIGVATASVITFGGWLGYDYFVRGKRIENPLVQLGLQENNYFLDVDKLVVDSTYKSSEQFVEVLATVKKAGIVAKEGGQGYKDNRVPFVSTINKETGNIDNYLGGAPTELVFFYRIQPGKEFSLFSLFYDCGFMWAYAKHPDDPSPSQAYYDQNVEDLADEIELRIDPRDRLRESSKNDNVGTIKLTKQLVEDIASVMYSEAERRYRRIVEDQEEARLVKELESKGYKVTKTK